MEIKCFIGRGIRRILKKPQPIDRCIAAELNSLHIRGIQLRSNNQLWFSGPWAREAALLRHAGAAPLCLPYMVIHSVFTPVSYSSLSHLSIHLPSSRFLSSLFPSIMLLSISLHLVHFCVEWSIMASCSDSLYPVFHLHNTSLAPKGNVCLCFSICHPLAPSCNHFPLFRPSFLSLLFSTTYSHYWIHLILFSVKKDYSPCHTFLVTLKGSVNSHRFSSHSNMMHF